jgi:hypothetical protein
MITVSEARPKVNGTTYYNDEFENVTHQESRIVSPSPEHIVEMTCDLGK